MDKDTDPGSWVMERKMLLTIKQRAERLARAQPLRTLGGTSGPDRGHQDPAESWA